MRRSRGVRRSSGTRSLPAIYSYNSFSSTAYLETANPGGIAGAGAGFWVALLLRIPSQAVSSTSRVIASHANSSATGGWEFRITGSLASLVFACANGSATRVASPTLTITAGMVGKWLHLVGVHDGTTVRLYSAGAEVGSGSAITGYTGLSSRTRIGNAGAATTLPADGIDVHGMAGGAGVPNAAAVLANYTATKNARVLQSISSITDHRWYVQSAAVATVNDLVGSDNLSVTGAVAAATADSSPVFV